MTTLTWTARDAWTITLREFGHWRKQPWEIVIGLAFPIMLLLMFGYLLGGAMQVSPDPAASYIDYLVPGMLTLAMAFGLESTLTAVAADTQRGITDRFRSLPMSRGAVLLGRVVADLATSVLGLVALMATGLVIGWRWHSGLTDAVTAFGLLLLLRFAFLWIGLYLGLVFRGPGGTAAVQILIWPFAFLSGVFVPVGSMPDWIATLAAWNPITATVTAVRELFGNPVAASSGWAGEHALLLAVLWPVVLTAVFAGLAVRRWATLGR